VISLGNCYSQDITVKDVTYRSQWINAGIGGSEKLSSLTLGLHDNYEKSRFLSLRYIYSEATLKYSKNGVTDYQDWGLLHGWMYKKEYIFLTASAGISLLRSSKTVENNVNQQKTFSKKTYYLPSLPVEMKLMFIPFKSFSLGGSVNVNFNSLKGYQTFMFEIGIGEFR
jgi:hypothetical protein